MNKKPCDYCCYETFDCFPYQRTADVTRVYYNILLWVMDDGVRGKGSHRYDAGDVKEEGTTPTVASVGM